MAVQAYQHLDGLCCELILVKSREASIGGDSPELPKGQLFSWINLFVQFTDIGQVLDFNEIRWAIFEVWRVKSFQAIPLPCPCSGLEFQEDENEAPVFIITYLLWLSVT